MTTKLTGREGVVKQVEDIMFPVGRMDGDSLPVSAFLPHVDGQFEQGAAAYEKRGVSVSVPTWDASKCIQCNNCAYVCPHATIRPFALTEEEAAKAPAAAKIVDVKAGKGKGVYKYTMAVSPLDCMGCGVCVGVCPVGALTMVGQEEEAAQQDVFDYCVAESLPRPTCRTTPSRAASSSSPIWSSPAPAPAAPRPAMPVSSPSSSVTGCTSPTPPAAPPSGAVLPQLLPTAPIRTATVPLGRTPCSRITLSTALACIWARRPPATVWLT